MGIFEGQFLLLVTAKQMEKDYKPISKTAILIKGDKGAILDCKEEQKYW